MREHIDIISQSLKRAATTSSGSTIVNTTRSSCRKKRKCTQLTSWLKRYQYHCGMTGAEGAVSAQRSSQICQSRSATKRRKCINASRIRTELNRQHRGATCNGKVRGHFHSVNRRGLKIQ